MNLIAAQSICFSLLCLRKVLPCTSSLPPYNNTMNLLAKNLNRVKWALSFKSLRIGKVWCKVWDKKTKSSQNAIYRRILTSNNWLSSCSRSFQKSAKKCRHRLRRRKLSSKTRPSNLSKRSQSSRCSSRLPRRWKHTNPPASSNRRTWCKSLSSWNKSIDSRTMSWGRKAQRSANRSLHWASRIASCRPVCSRQSSSLMFANSTSSQPSSAWKSPWSR